MTEIKRYKSAIRIRIRIRIFQIWHTARLDSFVSKIKNKLSVFISPVQYPNAMQYNGGRCIEYPTVEYFSFQRWYKKLELYFLHITRSPRVTRDVLVWGPS